MAETMPSSTNPTASGYPSIDSTASNPAANGNTSGQLQNAAVSAKDSVVGAGSSTLNSMQNSEAIQQLSSGPVAQNAKDQAAKTSTEFQNLADSRTTPSEPAATGQPLTHYHSMFYNLLSWENPRASAIAFAGTVAFIFMARYLNIMRYGLKLAYIVLGVTAALEIIGKLLFDNGLMSSFRPRKYYTIPRESLERSLEDVEQLLNFFVIESQRVVFAENVYATLAVFAAALISYGLIKVIPFWGLSLIGTIVIYLTPLVYIKNSETIDELLDHTNKMVSTQASQLKDLTAQHAGKATDSMKSYAGEYSSKASGYMGRKSPNTTSAGTTIKSEPGAGTSSLATDYPPVPKQDPSVMSSGQIPSAQEPLISH